MSSGVERPRRKNALLAVLRVVGRRSARGGGATYLRSVDGPERVDRVVVVPGAPVDRPRIPSTCRRSGKVARRRKWWRDRAEERVRAGDDWGRVWHRMRGARERGRRGARGARDDQHLNNCASREDAQILARPESLISEVGGDLGMGSELRPSNVAEGSPVARQGGGRSDLLVAEAVAQLGASQARR